MPDGREHKCAIGFLQSRRMMAGVHGQYPPLSVKCLTEITDEVVTATHAGQQHIHHGEFRRIGASGSGNEAKTSSKVSSRLNTSHWLEPVSQPRIGGLGRMNGGLKTSV